jgi:hypothetical protein
MMLKKAWKTPELIVLVRNKPEEAVLTTCKGGSFTGSGTQRSSCTTNASGCGTLCTIIATS